MANMRYNDIRLPAIPEHDDALLYEYITENSYGTGYYLYLSPVELVAATDTDGDVYMVPFDGADATGLCTSVSTRTGDDDWQALEEYTFSANDPVYYPVWCNTDLKTEDGTVHLAASEPVLSDILYNYNGVELPGLPESILSSHASALIVLNDAGIYTLMYTEAPLQYRVDSWGVSFLVLNISQDEFSRLSYVLSDNGVHDFDPDHTYHESAIAIYADNLSLIWANYDVCNATDGTVVLAASEPVYVGTESSGGESGGEDSGGGSEEDGGGTSETEASYVCSDWRIPFVLGVMMPLIWNPAAEVRLTWAALEALTLLFDDIENITWTELEFYQ